MRSTWRSLVCVAAFLVAGAFAWADEGMWTYDNIPASQWQSAYGFAPSAAWLERLRLASTRLNDGGSGSFVSPSGLIMSNHHVALNCIQNLSSQGHDYVNEGFYAATREQEPACPGYEVDVLLRIEDVTARVVAAAPQSASDEAASLARKAECARIEKTCVAGGAERCDVVNLYRGGQYHLYTYKKYTDVRLVFAPEQQTAFFGGDPDNFTFPRHDLDVSFLRAYEKGQPAVPAAYLAWSSQGIGSGDVVFVSGNPGSTARLKTMDQVVADRDVLLPARLAFLRRTLDIARAYAAQGEEPARRVRARIFGLENSVKAYEGFIAALRDEAALARKAAEEHALQERVRADAALLSAVGDPWAEIAAAQKQHAARYAEAIYVGYTGSKLLGIAGTIVRYVSETHKPNESRLDEFRDSNLASLENQLFSPAPIYADMERATLTGQLQQASDVLGREHPFVKAALAGQTPAEVAEKAVSGTKLADPKVRRALVKGGTRAIARSDDPMIALARRLEPLAIAVRHWLDDEIVAVYDRAGERLGRARWAVLGKSTYPDATFTLRITSGVVKGYPAEGTTVAPFTTFYGLYDRAAANGNRPPWDLPARWQEGAGRLRLATPLDFVSTADVVGGNSGSPVVDRQGQVVGLVFDGNIQSLALDYYYTEAQARTVAVDSRALIEALDKIYGASALVNEIRAAK